jgi:general secretion pathway protein D
VKKLAALLLVIGLVNAPAAFAQEAAQTSPPSAPPQSDSKKSKASEDYVTLNFTNIDIGALVKVMSELTRRNFLLDERVVGKVTIMTPNKISPEEAYQVFLSALEIKGFTAIEDGQVTRIIPAAAARQSGLKVLQDGTMEGEGYVTKLIRLTYVNPEEIVRTIAPLVSRDGTILAYPVTNSVIITDAVSNLRKLENLIHIMDVAAPEGKGKINVYYLKNANAEDLAKQLQALISRLPVPPAGKGQASSGTILEGRVNISADKATNSLIVVAAPDDFEVVKDVIQKLDIKRRQVYVEAAIVEMSLTKTRDLGFEFQTPVKTSSLNDNATSVSTVGGTNFGNIGNVIAYGPAALAQMPGLAVGAIKGTFTFQGKQYLSVGALLHALQADGDVNVLSTPNIMTMDNQKAEIMVGQNVPFITGQTQNATTGAGTLFNTVDRKDVGIKLTITPQISSDESVRLEVNQEISDVIATSTSNPAGPTTSKRSASTTVVVKDRQTMVIGGLIRDNVTSSASKVPFLGDIPILGWLFKSKTTSVEKTNLMIFITPYIVKNEEEASELTKRKNDSLEEFRKEYRMEKKVSEPVLLPRTSNAKEQPAATATTKAGAKPEAELKSNAVTTTAPAAEPGKSSETSGAEIKSGVATTAPVAPVNAVPELKSGPVATAPLNAAPAGVVGKPVPDLKSNAVTTAPSAVVPGKSSETVKPASPAEGAR